MEDSYTRLCHDLLRIRLAAGQSVDALVSDVATGRRKVTLGEIPQVNLLVFNFDAGQKGHDDWRGHSAALKKHLAEEGAELYAKGEPKDVRL